MSKQIQTFNDGVVSINKVSNLAPPGDIPREGLLFQNSLRYHERTVGYNRYFVAKREDIKVDYVIRCPEVRGLSEKNTDILVAILIDGQQYKVMQIQYIEDVQPPSMDLTLERLGDFYDVS